MLNKDILSSNISALDKELLIKSSKKIDKYFSEFEIEVEYGNSTPLFSNLKIRDIIDDRESYIVRYDDRTNTIIQNFGNSNFNTQKYEYELIKSLLTIISKRYNPENNNYDSGLICEDTDFNIHGKKLNEMLKSYLSTLITGYNDEIKNDFYIDSPIDYETLPDRLIHDMLENYDAEKILRYFISGNGNMLFQDIGHALGDESSAVEFYKSIDDYENNKIKSRKIYDVYMKKLKEKKLEDAPKM